ncbi:D-lactate dehydrogenase, mitochondrial isoform X2-like [Oopsacas minuta]|uniref:Probable D-lactate dehydrogenase, mitochondrial n=1 Tax=Oopsacas minuta TaxID=111878 RepID=A0AAV7K268_9METZ|nr:D-lactate dehydrogenase, mitochondrial isoform X2-like [Oopsacas minuta]
MSTWLRLLNSWKLQTRFTLLNHINCIRYSSRISDELLDKARSIVGDNNFTISEAARLLHGRDESYHVPLPPDLILFPTSTKQVSEIAKLCTIHKIPMIPFGTGTGLEGGVGATRGGVTLNMTRMDQILEVSTDDLFATVRPGVTRSRLNNHIRDTGMWFPIDPGADASLCGMVVTSASGTNAVRYGTMKENVINMEVVLANGDVINTSGTDCRAKKSSAGYNLTGLFVGCEGTLGIMTAATLRLYGIPESVSSAVCSFPSVYDAISTATMVIQAGIPVARLEFLDDVMMSACNKYSGLSYDETASLFLEFHGSSNSVEEQAELAKEIAKDNNSGEFQWTTDPEERSRLWKARHDALYASKALLPGCEVYITDVCVPMSNLPDVIVKSKQAISESGCIAPIVGHVGDGNFHCCFLLKPGDNEELKKVREIAMWMGRLAISARGTCTGEHGVGRGKIQLVQEQYGEDGISLMRNIKFALDPDNIMNPGKVITL